MFNKLLKMVICGYLMAPKSNLCFSNLCRIPSCEHSSLDELVQHAHHENIRHLLPLRIPGHHVLLVFSLPCLGPSFGSPLPHSSCRSIQCCCWSISGYSCNLVQISVVMENGCFFPAQSKISPCSSTIYPGNESGVLAVLLGILCHTSRPAVDTGNSPTNHKRNWCNHFDQNLHKNCRKKG